MALQGDCDGILHSCIVSLHGLMVEQASSIAGGSCTATQVTMLRINCCWQWMLFPASLYASLNICTNCMFQTIHGRVKLNADFTGRVVNCDTMLLGLFVYAARWTLGLNNMQ